MTESGVRPPNPYVGPRAFRAGERLYGRDREVAELLDLLIAERIVLLHSPSGAGKTSLIQAALIPRIQEEGFQILPVVRVSLEPQTIGSLNGRRFNRYLLSALLSLEEGLPPEQQVPVGELTRLDLADYLDRQWPSVNGDANSVLIFDQFEEVLTVDPTDQAAKSAFFAEIGESLRNRGRWALFAIREDYLAGLDPYRRPIPTRLATTFRLDFLRVNAARQAVQEPARQAGVDFSDEATTRLIDDLRRVRVQRADGTTEEQLGPYVEPVQLQVVCHRLWEKLAPGRREIVAADVATGGDVDSALAGYYAEQVETIAGATGTRKRTIREWIERHLITEQGIRGQVLQGPERSQGLENRVIWSLVNAHLVRAEVRRGATWFELAHDRLIEPIRKSNAAWREAHLSTLQHQAALWESQGRPDGLLLRSEALVEAERWAGEHLDELTPVESDFLAECREARAIEEREQRQARRLRILAIAASAVSVIAIAALVVALVFFARAEQQRRLASSRELAALAISNLDVDPERSVALALRAVATTYASDRIVLNEAEDALQRAVQASRAELTLTGHTNWVNDVAFNRDGSRLATASADGSARIWDAASGELLQTLDGRSGWALDVAFSPDGTRLATAHGDNVAKIWDASSGELLLTIEGHEGSVFGVAFSPDGRRLATASWDRTARIWEVASGRELHTLTGHTDQVKRVAFSPDGARLATTADDRTARLWDATSGEPLQTLSGHASMLYDLAFSPDGRYLATASDDRTARVWDLSSGRSIRLLSGHSNSVHGVSFNPDGAQVATGSLDGTVKVWDFASGKLLLTLAGHSNPIDSVTYSPDGSRLASASRDLTAKVWNATAGHTASVTGVVFSADGSRLASSGDDWTARVWEASGGRLLRTLTGHTNRVKDVAFSPDGARIATASDDRTARVWDALSGEPLLVLSGHTDKVTLVAFSPDGGRLATGGLDRTARVWNTRTGRLLLTLTGHSDWLSGIVFTPDGTRLVTSSGDRTVRIWDLTSGETVRTIASGRVRGVAASPDGKYVATANEDGTARIWDAATGEERLVLRGHSNVVNGVAFSPDGTVVATASWDKTVILWDVLSGKELRSLNQTAEVYRVAFSPDGRRLATAGSGNTVNVYLLEVEELMATARTRITRPLTPDECLKYLHQEPCPPLP